ncbi:MAG: peptidoglycan editing factor PgeF [Bacteroidetes bacterium]|nr:peptidoglycan editing factor PgeF [Bacteroidota bacterium]MCH8523533.1 peptidoglycan editing factor PgeF [Balneolales bacterium]
MQKKIEKNKKPFFDTFLRKSKTVVSGFSVAATTLSEADMGINTKTPAAITAANRDKFTRLVTGSTTETAYLQQVHGNDVVYAKQSGFLGQADGLVTDIIGLPLAILVADCAAVLLADERNNIVGALHVGWRGAATGIIAKGVYEMRELGAEKISAWISPCIGTHAFEVGHDVACFFPSAFVLSDGYEKPRVDLQGFIEHQLVKCDIKHQNIYADQRCTVTDSRFFSYRRQGTESGRMMALIMLKS